MKSRIINRGALGLVVVLAFVGLTVSGCERTEESFRTQRNEAAVQPNAPVPQTAELIKRLKGAEELDVSEANQKGVSAVAWQDYMVQAGKAKRAALELSHGFDVSKPELDDALFVPPRSMSGAEKGRLIQQVRQAIQEDDRNENALRADTNYAIPYPTDAMSRVEDHKNLAEGVVKDLEIGEPVHWATVQDAMRVPEPEH
jgi:hypothetical protein